jgi:hypothetical protein
VLTHSFPTCDVNHILKPIKSALLIRTTYSTAFLPGMFNRSRPKKCIFDILIILNELFVRQDGARGVCGFCRPTPAGPVRWQYWPPEGSTLIFCPRLDTTSGTCTTNISTWWSYSFLHVLGQQLIRTLQNLPVNKNYGQLCHTIEITCGLHARQYINIVIRIFLAKFL